MTPDHLRALAAWLERHGLDVVNSIRIDVEGTTIQVPVDELLELDPAPRVCRLTDGTKFPWSVLDGVRIVGAKD